MLINLCFYTLIFNLFSLLIITNNNDCKCKGWKMPLNASQCLFKSFSHSGNTLLSLKNLSFQVSFFSRTFTIISKCKRSPWCKQVNVNCFDCFKNFLSNSLQLSFLSFCFFFVFVFLIIPLYCLLSFSTYPRHSFLHIGVARSIKDSRMKKWKDTSRGTSVLYYNHKVRSGGAWKTMWLLGHTFPMKLTFITRLIETSFICTRIGLTSIFSIGCFFNRSLVHFSTSSWLDKL
jgi:hypothetical protein